MLNREQKMEKQDKEKMMIQASQDNQEDKDI
jgi:hypothetical protein